MIHSINANSINIPPTQLLSNLETTTPVETGEDQIINYKFSNVLVDDTKWVTALYRLWRRASYHVASHQRVEVKLHCQVNGSAKMISRLLKNKR